MERQLGVRSAAVIAVAVLGFATAPASAQQGPEPPPRVLTGVVIDELTRNPIVGAVVLIEDHFPGTVTDSTGHFSLSGFPPGPQSLVVRQFGYADIAATVYPMARPKKLLPATSELVAVCSTT